MQAVTITQITPPELESLIENTLRKILSIQPTVTKEEQEELLTVKGAAEFLRLSVPTIYTLISKGEIPVMKRSKRCYFSKTELMEYLKEGRKKTNKEVEKDADAFLSTRKKRG